MIIGIDGLDRIGKSSLCSHLRDGHGFGYMHFGRPEGTTDRERAFFQKGSFDRMFKFVEALENQQDTNVVMDRTHLGELVYGPMYRGSSGVDLSYIHDMEAMHGKSFVLILLVHTKLEVLRSRDDGLGFDISKLDREQELFVEAFASSKLQNKTILDVTDLSLEQVRDKLDRLLGLPPAGSFGSWYDVLKPDRIDVEYGTPDIHPKPKFKLIRGDQ